MPSLSAFLQPVTKYVSALLIVSALGGCGLLPEQKDETAGWSAQKLYGEAKDAMSDGAWDKAVKMYEKLEARYPYGQYAQQAQMEIAYSYWKAGEPAAALAAADRFIKLHPNHPAVDYIYYLKGLVNFNEDLGLLGALSNQDMTQRDPKSARVAFDSFKELIQRFPNSKYAEDSTARLNYLVYALAAHEVGVARYYMKRGAYLAAANRVQHSVKTYPEASANEEGLAILVQAYDKLGMNELRDDALRVMKNNFPKSKYLNPEGLVADNKKPWWQLW